MPKPKAKKKSEKNFTDTKSIARSVVEAAIGEPIISKPEPVRKMPRGSPVSSSILADVPLARSASEKRLKIMLRDSHPTDCRQSGQRAYLYELC